MAVGAGAGAAPSSSASSLSTTHVLHRLLRPPPRQPTLLSSATIAAFITRKALLFKSQESTRLRISTRPTTLFSFLSSTSSTHSIVFSNSFCASALSSPSNALNPSLSLEEEEEEEEEEDDDDDIDGEIEYDEEDIDCGSDNLELEDNAVSIGVSDRSPKEGIKRDGFKVPNLTVKERKELASYAHGLGKKLKCQLVGKSGVTDNVVSSFIETLEANELLKIKIRRTCPGELEDVVQRLEEATGSVVVGQIGRTVIVYRPSLSKMKAEEKMKQARRVYVRKDTKLKPVTRSKEVQRLSGRGHRGSSRI